MTISSFATYFSISSLNHSDSPHYSPDTGRESINIGWHIILLQTTLCPYFLTYCFTVNFLFYRWILYILYIYLFMWTYITILQATTFLHQTHSHICFCFNVGNTLRVSIMSSWYPMTLYRAWNKASTSLDAYCLKEWVSEWMTGWKNEQFLLPFFRWHRINIEILALDMAWFIVP